MALWLANYAVYGKRKLWKAARRAGHDIGREQTARIMRQLGIRGASRAKKRFTTHADSTHVRASDLVKRNFTAARPDQLWVCDFTYSAQSSIMCSRRDASSSRAAREGLDGRSRGQ
jgi:putative transposase